MHNFTNPEIDKLFVFLPDKMKGTGIETKSFQEIGWLKLDNAAKLFPAIMSGELTSVFRITALLKKPIRFSKIKEAVEITSQTFSIFQCITGERFILVLSRI